MPYRGCAATATQASPLQEEDVPASGQCGWGVDRLALA